MLAAVLLMVAGAARAEHFEYQVDLTGTYSSGGTDGCYPPDFDQPACPQPGSLSAMLSFDTPSSADGAYTIEGDFGDVTDFAVSLGSLQSSTEELFGGINLNGGVPNGSVQGFDQSETFIFDWAHRSASFSYDYGYHNPNGQFSGSLSAVPEPDLASLLLAGMAGLLCAGRRRAGPGRRN